MMAGHIPPRHSVPRVLLLTDGRSVANGRTLVATIAAALDGGVDGVVVRERELAPDHRHSLGFEVRGAAQAAGSSAALLWAAPAPSHPRRTTARPLRATAR